MTILNRREFLGTAALASAGIMIGSKNAMAFTQEFQFEETTVATLQTAMASGQMSARKIAEGYLARIASIDKKLNAIIELNPDALAIADLMDAERKAGKVRGPLHGIPVVIKDNIDTADKMKTTAGSLALLNAPTPKRDAFIVTQLRNAGAVIIAKTNLSEWANFRSTKSSSGWSGRGGQTHNPYILDRNPCGSSSGSGAAIAANLAAIAVGTETDGSVICPSATCGIVGIKPTLGLVSRSGIIPIAHSQDTAGPMCRTVADAAALLTVMAEHDPNDAITSAAAREKKDYTQFLRKDGLRGMKIGVARQYFGRSSKVDALIEPHLQVLKSGGATLVDVEFPKLRDFGDAEYEVLLYEFKEDLNKYLAARGGPNKTIKDLIDFNNKNAEKEMPYFGQEIFIQAEAKGGLEERAYQIALLQSKLMTQEQGIDAVVQKAKVDAFVAPSGGVAWMTDLVGGDCGVFESSSLAAVAGYPNITVPAGYIQGLPAGISFFGKAFSEPTLIQIAYAFEQATKARVAPKFLPTFA
ncbi:MAG TPA: amidase [Pyrinomonadaceae bacterium]|nr:amidase [Pyrinomonadaceae bacterium]